MALPFSIHAITDNNNENCLTVYYAMETVQKHAQQALESDELKMAKYYGYKALKATQEVNTDFKECANQEALAASKKVEGYLKKAMKSPKLEDAKYFLGVVLKHLKVGIYALESEGLANDSTYGDDLLVMNTKEVLGEQGGVVLTKDQEMQEKMAESLAEFQKSLHDVVTYVDCEDAFNFITKILAKSKTKIAEKTTSSAQRQYHIQIRDIAQRALLRLQGCPTK